VLRRLLFNFLAVGAAAALTVAIGVLVYARHLEGIVVEKFNGRRWNLPSRVYSDPFLIYPGVDLAAAGLFDRLQRLNYREVTDETLRKGDYRRTASGLDLFLHDFSFPEKEVLVGRPA